ncbi:MAG: membrane integrity-associated transporter subunit PqiC [bacterium]|nr:membrane integrity-associated transporter subunit PqiC [bacterium]
MTAPSHAALLLLVLASGCLFRAEAPTRWYEPGSPLLAADDDPPPAATGRPLRLRSVRAIPFLRERMAWRTSPVESGLYEQRRWRRMPATYVEEALRAELERTPGIRLTDDAHAPALRVEVLAFDEVLRPRRAALVTVRASLADAGAAGLDRTFSAEEPLADADPAAIADAMGAALGAVVTQVAQATSAALPSRPR